MKHLLKTLRIALFSAVALAAAPAAHAQININVNPPSWGPAVPAGAQYYYIPETNGFYDVRSQEYVVSRNGQWYRTRELGGYNPNSFHPVVVDYVGAQPWSRYDEYRNRYPRGGNPSNGGLPPGQAKKLNRRGYDNGQYGERRDDHERHDEDHRRYERRDDRDRGRNGGIYVPLPGARLPDGRRDDDRRYDDRREDRRRYERRDDDNRRYERDDDDDHGKYKNKGKGKKDKD